MFGCCRVLPPTMRRSSSRRSLQLRSRYIPPPPDRLNYFPGHMRSGLYQVEARLRSCDAVVEVHDARVPFSGRNPRFSRRLLSARPHLLLLNKADLVPEEGRAAVLERLHAHYGEENVIYACCKDQSDLGLRSVVDRIGDMLGLVSRTAQRNFMVLGVPNVGKSSLINALRARHMRLSRASPVGAVPGVTRSVLMRIRVSHRPTLFVFDTPGVLVPQLKDYHAALRLALCAALQDHMVGVEHLADYLLYQLNLRRRFEYVEYMRLQGPTDDIKAMLIESARAMGKSIRRKDLQQGGRVVSYPDTDHAAYYMIHGFRAGKLGLIMLDEDHIDGSMVSSNAKL